MVRTNEVIANRLRRRRQWHWAWRVAALWAIGLAIFGVLQYRDTKTTERPDAITTTAPTVAQETSAISVEERDLWEVALIQDELDDSGETMDAIAITDLSIFFDEAESQVNDTLGKEINHENNYA